MKDPIKAIGMLVFHMAGRQEISLRAEGKEEEAKKLHDLNMDCMSALSHHFGEDDKDRYVIWAYLDERISKDRAGELIGIRRVDFHMRNKTFHLDKDK